ncbi:hypothetical protein [Janibacter limosus]|uniref:hypothetical protein n=1 Tax=Janibacter limosus TaxID=53458 RepID=UPI0008375A88|nr:hypothetical protein [Janibacter limosus]
MGDDMGPVSFDDSAVIRLLDHQIVDADGHHLGKVDDLSLRQEGEDLLIDALMVGPAALAPRYPGLVGRWGWAIWRRLNDADDPGMVLVPLGHIVDMGSDVQVDARTRDVLLSSFGLENWLRRHLIGRIPGPKGGKHLPEESHPARTTPGDGTGEAAEAPERGSTGPRHRLTELLHMDVVDATGEPVGRVTDVRSHAEDIRDGIALTSVLVGPRLMGSKLGYSSDEQDGPRAISWIIGRMHRSAHWHDLADVAAISWEERRLEIADRG